MAILAYIYSLLLPGAGFIEQHHAAEYLDFDPATHFLLMTVQITMLPLVTIQEPTMSLLVTRLDTPKQGIINCISPMVKMIVMF